MTMKTGITRILFAVAAVMLAAVGMVFAIEADGGYGEGVDSATPMLQASVVGNAFTLENVGTSPAVDCGGAVIMAGSERVGILPFTTVLQPNPFIYTKTTPMAPKWFQKVELSRALVAGEEFTVTNGVGVYARGTAQ